MSILSSHSLNQGLQLWWLGLRGYGNGSFSFRDLSHYHRNGTLLNMEVTDWNPVGRPGGSFALNFGGTNEECEASDSAYKGISGSNPRSSCCWFRTTSSSSIGIYGWGITGTGSQYYVTLESGVCWLRMGGGRTANAGSGLNNGNWHHFMITYPNGGTVNDIKFYIDGIDITTSTGSGSAVLSTGSSVTVTMGNQGTTDWMIGEIDDFRIWNRTLTAEEAKTVYFDSLRGYPKTLKRRQSVIPFVPTVGGVTIPIIMKHLRNQKVA